MDVSLTSSQGEGGDTPNDQRSKLRKILNAVLLRTVSSWWNWIKGRGATEQNCSNFIWYIELHRLKLIYRKRSNVFVRVLASTGGCRVRWLDSSDGRSSMSEHREAISFSAQQVVQHEPSKFWTNRWPPLLHCLMDSENVLVEALVHTLSTIWWFWSSSLSFISQSKKVQVVPQSPTPSLVTFLQEGGKTKDPNLLSSGCCLIASPLACWLAETMMPMNPMMKKSVKLCDLTTVLPSWMQQQTSRRTDCFKAIFTRLISWWCGKLITFAIFWWIFHRYGNLSRLLLLSFIDLRYVRSLYCIPHRHYSLSSCRRRCRYNKSEDNGHCVLQ